ncbi:50S ribosomal protein L1 [Treponema endosymbiont of Eucomonympha sp.]|uniref:50S ribosomal protein L1 n=1 Tax=Treponema endosymbiont of Eucomonympha sp. TaxID=1580831 RepID=UPI00078295DC|nr:50S ribosomal protein L1 [Treponema endosymbiont of Eucomonympha sp.]
MKHGKKYVLALAKIDTEKFYTVAEACALVKEISFAKFGETIETHINVRLSKNQSVRDTLVFPNQFKSEKKVLVFCREDRVKEALDTGAAFAGDVEYIEKIKNGWFEFDVAVATPDMMKDVGRLGMILGRKGLMPNPKTGTVTNDIIAAINELKRGRTEYRADKGGVVHIAVGKVFMDSAKVAENIEVLLTEVTRKKPVDAKGSFIRSISVNSTMGPNVRVTYKSGE